MRKQRNSIEREKEGRGEATTKPGARPSAKRSRPRPQDNATGRESLVNLSELGDLIILLKENGLTEFELEREGFRIHLRRGFDYEGSGPAAVDVDSATSPARVSPPTSKTSAANAAIAAPSPAHPGASAETAASEDEGLHIISSPIVGTFYRARSPNAEPLVKTGSQVEPDTVVCIIEAMKLMNEIQAEARGQVAKIYVENGQPVEYGQPLFGIKS